MSELAMSAEETIEETKGKRVPVQPVVEVQPIVQAGCPIMLRRLDAVIGKCSVKPGQWGPEFKMEFRLDDPDLPAEINGKTIYSRIELKPKAPVMRALCRFCHRVGLLDFSGDYQKRSKDGGFEMMLAKLKDNLEELGGVWNPQTKEMQGGKIRGYRASIIITGAIEWPASPHFPHNYVYEVPVPDEASEEEKRVFSLFTVGDISSHVKGKQHSGQASSEDAQEEPESYDDVPF